MTKRTICWLLLITIMLFIFRHQIFNIIINDVPICEKTTLEINYLQRNLMEVTNNYQELLKIIDYKDMMLEDNYLVTSLLLRNQSTFYDSIIIRYGHNKNLEKDMIVISDKGLIGIIDKVEENYSFVKLLTAGTLSIPVKIGDTYGLISDYQDDLIIVSKINNFANLTVGEEVFTSSYGKYPENIFIGHIKKIAEDNRGLEKILYIESEVDFNNIKYVYINKQVAKDL